MKDVGPNSFDISLQNPKNGDSLEDQGRDVSASWWKRALGICPTVARLKRTSMRAPSLTPQSRGSVKNSLTPTHTVPPSCWDRSCLTA
jgi:hypothetical protein